KLRCAQYRDSRSFWIRRLGDQFATTQDTDHPADLSDSEAATRAIQTLDFAPYPSPFADFLFGVANIWVVGYLCWVALWRGGVSYRLIGLTLVQTDGRPAGRLRCSCRSALFWLPVLVLF